MKIGIVMPVVLQNEEMLRVTMEAIEHIASVQQLTLYLVCNRLHVCSVQMLRSYVQPRFRGELVVVHEPGVERSVAGAWNEGCRLALRDGAEYIAAVANDTRLAPDCVDTLVAFGENEGADLWSATSDGNRHPLDDGESTDGADFNCFMFRPRTLAKYGRFDPNFRPAYFEDNDYYGRVVLGGGECRVVRAATFFHHGSMTIRADPEMAHHVRHWFEINRAYFARKWGTPVPENTREGVLARYYPNPFNDPTKPISWFPTDDAPV